MVTMRALAAWFTPRRRLITVALLGWAVIVVLASGRTPRAGEWLTVPDLGSWVLTVLGVYTVFALALIVIIRPKLASRSGRAPFRSLRTLLWVTAAVVAAAWLFGSPEAPVEEEPDEVAVTTTVLPVDVAAAEHSRSGPTGGDIGALLLIALLFAVLLMRVRRRNNAGVEEHAAAADAELERRLAPMLDAAAAQLRDESDPRRGVLVAYASLEGALAEHGRGRASAETASEHLARALAELPRVVEPAVLLGNLYEYARFSENPVTEDDRTHAIEALAAARRSLSVAEHPA